MADKRLLVPLERTGQSILLIRGQKIILDADLAVLYGVSTKRLNEQVRRNISRFPPDFMFKLTAKEKAEVVANCDHLRKLKFSPSLPQAFTEHIRTLSTPSENSWRRRRRSAERSVF